VLFIMADDLGYADLGCYGQRDFGTPVLDELAAQGILLTHGYASSSVCSATRTALITGRYQYRLPVGLDEPGGGANQPGLPAGHPTLPSLFKRCGYRTALIGKWHIGSVTEHGPLKHGYGHFFGLSGGAADYFTHRIDITGRTPDDGLYQNGERVARSGYLTDVLGDEAIRYIERPDPAPFFLSLHFTAPHWPWEGPEDEAVSRSLTSLRHMDGGNLATYARMVRSMDANIGRVLETIRRRGLTKDTIVVFTSDNGGERFSDTWPFVGVKGELLEGGLRVPLILSWPRRIRPGQRSEQVMASMDFLPTLLAAAGGAPDPAYPPDGDNLLPVLLGEEPPRPRKLFWRFKANGQRALRDGDWKYLRLGGREYLFNLAQDARERADLKEKHPETFARLKAEYEAWDRTMLPYPPDSYSEDIRKVYVDRY
jgi:arylsulfatase A-like enzyme